VSHGVPLHICLQGAGKAPGVDSHEAVDQKTRLARSVRLKIVCAKDVDVHRGSGEESAKETPE
jgi:hypothetical protein